MPSFTFHKHSNRSKQDLTGSALGSGTPSSGGSADDLEASQARTTQHQNQPRNDDQYQPFIPQTSALDVNGRTYQPSGDLPSRSQSTRQPPHSYPSSQGPLSQPGGSADDLVLDSRRQQQLGRQDAGQALQQAPPAVVESRKKGFFSGLRSNKIPDQKHSSQPPSSYSSASGLARRISKRQHDNPVTIRTVQQEDSLEQQPRQDWHAGGASRPHLRAPLEGVEDDTGLDLYLMRESGPEQTHQYNIPAIQGGSEPPLNHSANEDSHQPQQYQVPHAQVQHHSPDSAQQNRYHLPNSIQTQEGNNRLGNLVITDQFRQQNFETVSQLSYESPIDQREEQHPVSVQSSGPSPTVIYPQRQDYNDRSTPLQGPPPTLQQPAMAPPPASSQQSRRSVDAKQSLQGPADTRDTREGQPPPTYQQQYPRNQPLAPGISVSQGPNYRGGPPQREQFSQVGNGEQGRSTPPLAPDRDVNDAYKELLQKYKKVKGLYFEKTAQVEQLQNTLANQRLSQSRTSLDDSEYMTRFQRLDGAITNLAFNIRKDWRIVPGWIAQYVNQDALKIGKQEMTAVGRSCISKFLVDEVFNKSFHPGLESDLSMNLKAIERNIRRFSPALNNQEESDALTSKVIQWRLTTLDGLKDTLNSPESEEYRKQFTQIATINLTASLINYLQEPLPAGLEDSVHMIVELAVGISANIPLESRDISIAYPMPGDPLQTFLMKVGEGIPALENPGAETASETDSKSIISGGSGQGDDSKDSDKVDSKSRKEKTKSGMFQAMMGSSSSAGKKSGGVSPGGAETGGEKNKNAEDGPQKVRFSGFLSIEVRGRQVLGKAPVWTVS